jgi:hypothetical protein
MGLDIKVIAFGFGALSLALGAVLLILSFNYTKDPTAIQQEQSAGWVFVGIGVIAWFLGFAERVTKKKRRGFGRR